MKYFKFLFEIEKKPRKGLLTVEWVVMGYLLLTLLMILFCYTKMQNPESMIWGRFHIVMMTLALWLVYRLIPCRFTHLCRILAQMFLLGWWYPDTYQLNQAFPNLDHVFAGYEQQLFGCQPALLFSQAISNPVFSELMHMGYGSYYPLIVLVTLFYFFFRNNDFDRAAFIIIGAFFTYYIPFVLLPVTGPQYYYLAAGVDNIAKGVFPDIGHYFATHDEGLPIPGYAQGFFYQFVASMHEAGECPTAAFPSSHVGITSILLMLVWHSKNRRLFLSIIPFFLLMCFATVYIQAHYVIDVLGGFLSAIIIYFGLSQLWKLRIFNK